jgi:hypothetical protein
MLKYEREKVFNKTGQTLIAPVLDDILQAVDRVAQANRVDLVLRGDYVLFASDRVDLTPVVVRELDRGAPATTPAGTGGKQSVSPARTPASRSK